ncbi:hypothetical protein B0H14DRAFT_2969307, partial [Mycena olivaceomarginata]
MHQSLRVTTSSRSKRYVPPSFVFVLFCFQETRAHANVLPDFRPAFQSYSSTHPSFVLSCSTCCDDLGVSQDRVYRRGTLEKPCRFLKLPVRRIGLGPQSLWIPRATISWRRAARILINETKASFMRTRKTPDSQRTARATNPIQSQSQFCLQSWSFKD